MELAFGSENSYPWWHLQDRTAFFFTQTSYWDISLQVLCSEMNAYYFHWKETRYNFGRKTSFIRFLNRNNFTQLTNIKSYIITPVKGVPNDNLGSVSLRCSYITLKRFEPYIRKNFYKRLPNDELNRINICEWQRYSWTTKKKLKEQIKSVCCIHRIKMKKWLHDSKRDLR